MITGGLPSTSRTAKRRPPAQHPRDTVPGRAWPEGAWQYELKTAIRSAAELRRAVGLAPSLEAPEDFPVCVPRGYVARMRCGDPDDPLLRQVLPSVAENEVRPGFRHDALNEGAAMIAPGLMQKYAGRALLLAAGSCAVNCRYCFRRHFPYDAHRQSSHFPSLDAIRADSSITEVILSGGDPLMLTDSHFANLVQAIGDIPHVTRLRIHTRTPVVIPERVTATLVESLAGARPRVVFVFHFNHPNEIDAKGRRMTAALSAFTLLNQSVLLNRVNDDSAVLAALSESLFDMGVLPYYLHMLDPVVGTGHFDVDEARALLIHRQLGATLPGYLVPRLVRETPGGVAKDMLASGGKT